MGVILRGSSTVMCFIIARKTTVANKTWAKIWMKQCLCYWLLVTFRWLCTSCLSFLFRFFSSLRGTRETPTNYKAREYSKLSKVYLENNLQMRNSSMRSLAPYAFVNIRAPMRFHSLHVTPSIIFIASALYLGLIRAITVVPCAANLLKNCDFI